MVQYTRGREPYRREDVEGLAVCLKCLHLAGKPSAAIFALAPVEGANTDGVTRRYEIPGRLVHQHTGKNAVQRVPQLI